MSAKKAQYPERPPAVKPKKPGKGLGKPSRATVGGKRQPRFEKAVPFVSHTSKEKVKEATFSGQASTTINSDLKAFMAKYRMNKIPLHQYGKKGRTLEV